MGSPSCAHGRDAERSNSDCITQIGGSSRVFEKGVVRVWSIVPESESESESESRMAKVRIIVMTDFFGHSLRRPIYMSIIKTFKLKPRFDQS